MDAVLYAFPQNRELSFSYVGARHVSILREKFNVLPIHLTALPAILQANTVDAYVHPYFYPLTTNGELRDALVKFRNRLRRLVGVDVADSNAISQWAVEMANMADAFIVNSEWSREAYVSSGVRVPVYVVPHGLEDGSDVDGVDWFRPKRVPRDPRLRFLADIKKRGVFTILYFLWHSGYRKGADLVAALMHCVEREGINYMLIVKKMDLNDPGLKLLSRFKTFILEGKLMRDDLIDLYDIADLVLLPSRGGSFEMSGLEALGRGVPVLMPNVGPWVEYTPPGLGKYLHVKTRRMVPVLPGNEIHTGLGAEWDADDACDKFMYIFNNYKDVRAAVEQGVEWVKQHYSWSAVKPLLWRAHERIFFG